MRRVCITTYRVGWSCSVALCVPRSDRTGGDLSPRRLTYRPQDVLLIKSNLTHMWGCCKGHVEPGDASLRATALRELHEESGVPPDAVTLLPDWRHTIHYTYRRKEGAVHDKTVHWFTGTCPASTPAALSDETEDVAWLDVATACRKLRNGQLKRLLRKCAAALGIEAPPPPQSKPQAGGKRRGRQGRHVRRGQAPGEAAGTHQPPPKRSG